MAGHLFLLSQKQITDTVAKTKKLQVSTKQLDKIANQISPNDFIILGVRKKDGSVILWLTAKASTGLVKSTHGGHLSLKFVKVRTSENCYSLSEGIAIGQSLLDINWKRLDDQEMAACFFDTEVYKKQIVGLKRAIFRALPPGLGVDSETVYKSVLLNAA